MSSRSRFRKDIVLDPERCSGTVRGISAYFWHQCPNKGRYEHEGKKWCKIHHPPTKAAKEARKHAMRDAQRARQRYLTKKRAFEREWFEKFAKAAISGKIGDLPSVGNRFRRAAKKAGYAYE